MRYIIVAAIFFNIFQCDKRSRLICSEDFFQCAKECSVICEKTINHAYEFGKCFSQCNNPCRKEHCKEARMVEVVDTEDLKSFANIQRGGSSPSASSILKRR